MNKITVNELFSGIGSQRKAMERLGVPHEVIGIAEIDRHAVRSYEALYGKTRNYGDISAISKLDYADFWTYSFPCQDISLSGKLAGIDKSTRSGLLYEVERLLNVSQEHGELPQYLMLENVKSLVGSKFIGQLNEWLEYLDALGYHNYWQVLNAINYGVPQNRERVFVISIRKDIDNGVFRFPMPTGRTPRLKDFLETGVDNKYYLRHELQERLKREYLSTTRDFDLQSISEPYIAACRGRYTKPPDDGMDKPLIEQRLEINTKGVSNTITTVAKDNYVIEPRGLRIRALTPRECWRLMGYDDSDFDKAEAVCSGRQLYKQAGNSIVVHVVYHIFNNLFSMRENNNT